MKKEELLNLLEEFKVDDEYVDEALSGNSDGRGIKVYAGKTKPIKIIAPIAVCLAVFAAAGVVFANRDKLSIDPNSALSAASSEESLSDEEILDQIREDFKKRPSYIDIENSNTINATYDGKTNFDIYPIVTQDQHFFSTARQFMEDKYEDLLTGDISWWKQEYIDVDYDGEFELLLCPQVNYETVKGVDVCVFKRVGLHGETKYLGSLSDDFTEKYFDSIYFVTDEANKCYYYYDCIEEYEKCIDTVYKIYYDKMTNAVREQPYLELVKTYPNDTSSDTPYTETAYRYGEKTSTEQLLDEWNSLKSKYDEEVLPKPNISGAHSEMNECVRLLVDKYDLSMSASALHRVVQYLDINNDGTDETLIEFRDCEQLKGIYVFSSDGRLIGEFDPEGYRGQRWGISGGMAVRMDGNIHRYNENGERYYFYTTSHTGSIKGLHIWLEEEVYKIVVNDDGTLSAVAALEGSYEDGFGSMDHFFINGVAVTCDEYRKEMRKYDKYTYPNVHVSPFVW